MSSAHDIYAGHDPRELPAYGVAEAAQYLGMPPSTLRSWMVGQKYTVGKNERTFRPVIRPARPAELRLSFLNLIEAHVLDALRRKHSVSLQQIRNTLSFLAKHYPSERPLADHRFETNGLDLFVEKYGQLINASRDGQLEMKEVIRMYLQRVERDDHGIPARLYPFTRSLPHESPRLVVIDPRVAFGKPVLAGTSIPTGVITERFKAGDSIAVLAGDYNRPAEEIQEAIRCQIEAA
jgi:uncharacterized protein (DUF433 family)